MSVYDVIVIGAGNAAFCSALSAQEQGARVLMLEAAPEAERSGNSRFASGVLRFAFRGIDDIRRLVPEMSDTEANNSEFSTYTEEQYLDDMGRVTEYRTDPDLTETFVRGSFDTLCWMQTKGIRFMPLYRQSFKIDGKHKYWGGLALESWGGGAGLVDLELKSATAKGVPIRYATRASRLIEEGGRITGVVVRHKGVEEEIRAGAVILACGGFSSNLEWRTKYLGPGWDLAKVRGTKFNNGDGIRMALDVGARPYGQWSGCHAVGWDLNAPEFGDLDVGENFQKHSYPFGIMVNAHGKRFLDEGADFRNYTYAKYGKVVLDQPGQFAWQVFDAKTTPMLRDEYKIKRITKVTANTIEELANKLEGVNGKAFLDEVKKYNAAVQTDVKFDPSIKDGRGTAGLEVPKTNWANTIDQGPFEAYAITCGITFTFGGIKIDTGGRVINVDGEAIEGLYCAGEMVGGLFYFNYAGGTGLVSGAVYGRIAGKEAAAYATK
jgi:tricarballylate dehydrogenase